MSGLKPSVFPVKNVSELITHSRRLDMFALGGAGESQTATVLKGRATGQRGQDESCAVVRGCPRVTCKGTRLATTPEHVRERGLRADHGPDLAVARRWSA